MFEVTDTDVAALGDTDLRTLVARLSLAELDEKGLPLVGVTAGGNQDAADGGIDVRVEVAAASPALDFIPRPTTGFQVKKSDMSAGAIKTEMRPDGALRPAIGDLAAAGGAYVIVSAQGSVTDKALAERRNAMRAAVAGHPNADELHVDFYDRERVATWINKYPGVVAWVRARVGRVLSGWHPIGDWTMTAVTQGEAYLCDATACLIDEHSKERENLTVLEGITRLRATLNHPRRAVRLIGLSGLGKTRLVQALFDTGIGEASLDPGLAIYTDYSEETTPGARDMAHWLIDTGRRAILVVDNCNPQTHAHLARICTGNKGYVSLITVEYDVRDDEPERTEVFRLQNASPALVEKWLEREFDHIFQLDRNRIATFSDGNFRVARALAETLRKGETLGQLKDRDLFERIFRQRHAHDQSLQLAAEDLSLLYSFDGDDCTQDSELARIAAFRQVTSRDLFTAAVDLRRRGVVQARGQWRAVLPPAIANPLAAYALQRIPDADFDAFCASLSARMLRSLSRRLGYLHNSPESQRIVSRWLAPGGLIGNLLLSDIGLEIARNIAPVAPRAVLGKIIAEITGADGKSITAVSNRARRRWIGLLKVLAYEPEMFDDAAMALARFVAAEPLSYNTDSATTPFGELFHLRLSGTHATPQQRRDFIRSLSRESDPAIRRCASLALNETFESHFLSTSSNDFGTQPRDLGWAPSINGDIYDWLSNAIKLTLELEGAIDDGAAILARNIRQLWHYPACQHELERASELLSHNGPWINGWLACRTVLRFDGDAMPATARVRLLQIIERLQPSDMLSQARAFVLTGYSSGFDIADGGEDDPVKALTDAANYTVELGKTFAVDNTLLRTFLPEVFAKPSAGRAWEFGKGLAMGADDIACVWQSLHDELTKVPDYARNYTLLGGFLSGAVEHHCSFVANVLDGVSIDPVLARCLPWLQSQVGLDEFGIQRLVKAIDGGQIDVSDLKPLVTGVTRDTPALPLRTLLKRVAVMVGGLMLSLDILHTYIYCCKDEGREIETAIIACGRVLLWIADYSQSSRTGGFHLKAVVEACLSGTSGEAGTRRVCCNIRHALNDDRISTYDIDYLLEGLFDSQPSIALDELLIAGSTRVRQKLFKVRFDRPTLIERVAPEVLQVWAGRDPNERYPVLGHALALFAKNANDDETTLSPLFLVMLENAPNRAAFLGDARDRIWPRGWTQPLHLVLERRRMILRTLSSHHDPAVRTWLADQEVWLATSIVEAQARQREREGSFE